MLDVFGVTLVYMMITIFFIVIANYINIELEIGTINNRF
jgi:hypothetical protein